MAQKTVVELFDDLDGTTATETVHFGISDAQGVYAQYEIDLSEDHAEELRDFLARYADAARRVRKDGAAVKQRKTRVRAGGDRTQKGAIREWARTNFPDRVLSDRGRLPKDVLDAFEVAHSGKPHNEETSAPVEEAFPTFASV